eukprot:m.941661 g.941661  ORF g.941661 m.941661 type:complete len:63 (+) comp258742_c0_seq1:3-191(+)
MFLISYMGLIDIETQITAILSFLPGRSSSVVLSVSELPCAHFSFNFLLLFRGLLQPPMNVAA